MKWTIVCVLMLLAAGQLFAETKEEEAARYLETMNTAVREGNDPMRNRMFIKLRYLGAPSVQPLLGDLADEDAAVRRYAAFTLGFFDDPAVIEPLMKLFKEDPSVDVRCSSAEALGRLECAEAVDLLLGSLDEGDAKVRQSVAYSLGLIGDERAKPALEKKKSSDPDELVRFFAGDAIVQIDRAVARRNRS